MMNKPPGGVPAGALPVREAIRKYVPKNLWDQYRCAVEDRRRFPTRTIRLSSYIHGADADRSNQIARQTRSAQGAVTKAYQAIIGSLVEQLNNGRLTAIAQTSAPFGEWQAIPAERWHRLRIGDAKRGEVTGPNVSLTDVHIIEGDRIPPADIKLPQVGRPTARDLTVAEFKRRADAGEALPVLRQEAEVLSGWLERNFKKKLHASYRTIENHIREEFKKWMARRKQKASARR